MMTEYESLLSEYDDDLLIEERPMIIDGLYCDNVIWINGKMTNSRKACVLAEEIGHHETSAGNILNQNELSNQKQELKARKWAFNKLIPFENVLKALDAGCRQLCEFAEYFDLDEEFVKDCFKCYGIL